MNLVLAFWFSSLATSVVAFISIMETSVRLIIYTILLEIRVCVTEAGILNIEEKLARTVAHTWIHLISVTIA